MRIAIEELLLKNAKHGRDEGYKIKRFRVNLTI
jgi:hypothetical protein